jgi:hypothetical protein
LTSQHGIPADKSTPNRAIRNCRASDNASCCLGSTESSACSGSLESHVCALGGAIAFIDGESQDDCPWDPGSVERRWWELGWSSAQTDASEDFMAIVVGEARMAPTLGA